MVFAKIKCVICRRSAFLPNNIPNKIRTPKHLIHYNLKVMSFIVVDGHPDRAVLGQQIAQQFQPRPHHGEPARMLQIVVVVLEGRARVVGRIDIDALHPPGVERQQRLQRFQIVALDQHVAGVPVPGR